MDQRAAAEKLLPAGAITFQMDEEDVRRIMAHPMSVIGSDGIPHDAHPHPAPLWGTFPRVLGLYSRQLGLLSMEQAIHKMTGRTASLFGMIDRGVLRPGAYADLVLFDPHKVMDRATFEDPKQEIRRHRGGLDQRRAGLPRRQRPDRRGAGPTYPPQPGVRRPGRRYPPWTLLYFRESAPAAR